VEKSFRSELHKIIDEASKDRVQEIYDLINNGMAETSRYSREEIKHFYGLLEEFEKGQSKSYTIEETIAIARTGKNP